jgi:hypothetical protein
MYVGNLYNFWILEALCISSECSVPDGWHLIRKRWHI